MTISSRRKPGSYTELVSGGNNAALPNNPQELCLIGPRTSAGTVAKHIPTRVYSKEQAATYFGAGSILHRMAIAALAQYPYAVLTCVAVDDSDTGVQATCVITITGPASAAGTMSMKIGNDSVSVAIANADTATTVAAAFKAAINAAVDLPVTADNSSGVLTLTAKNDGTPGNMIGKLDTVSGKWRPVLTVACTGIAATVTSGFTGGANDPVLSSAYDAILPYRYHQIAIPYIDQTHITAFAAYLDLVSDDRNQRGARGYIAMTGALADATTIADTNSKRLHLGYIRKVNLPSYELAAAFAALQAGEPNLALPLSGRQLLICDAPDIADRLTDPGEVETLLYAGVTPFVVGTGEKVLCVRAITTYQLNAAGSADASWLDSSKIAIADYVREAIILRHARNFSDVVVKDEHAEGDPDFVVTPADVNSTNIDVLKRIEKLGYVEGVDAAIPLFVCARDANDPTRVNSEIPMNPVDPLMVLASTIKVST